MQSKIVSLDLLVAANRWRAEYHVFSKRMLASRYPSVALCEIVEESTRAINPIEYKPTFYFLGLENIESETGDIVNVTEVTSNEVRSRSKVFKANDILFGRLRPYLRKCTVIEAPFADGLCSTEFIILECNPELILSHYLREILISTPIIERISSMQSGAALPRVSAKDLLKTKIPLPPMSEQERIVFRLVKLKERRRDLLQKIGEIQAECEKEVSKIFNS
jgi:restriction endonuclease S subunit